MRRKSKVYGALLDALQRRPPTRRRFGRRLGLGRGAGRATAAFGCRRGIGERQLRGARWCDDRRGFGAGRRWHARLPFARHRERHALPVLARVDRDHVVDRHDDLARAAAETRPELDRLVAELQCAGRLEANVEHDLVVFDVLARHLHVRVDEHRDVRREAVVGAPIVQRTDEIRSGRRTRGGRGDRGTAHSVSSAATTCA